jgi:hypothetical protein
MKIKITNAKNKKLIGKEIDLGTKITFQEITGMWTNVTVYANVQFNKRVYDANVYMPTEKGKAEYKPHINLYVADGNGQGSSIKIWEFVEI